MLPTFPPQALYKFRLDSISLAFSYSLHAPTSLSHHIQKPAFRVRYLSRKENETEQICREYRPEIPGNIL